MCFRPPAVEKKNTCPQCDTMNLPDVTQCTNCGAELSPFGAGVGVPPPPGQSGGVSGPKAPPPSPGQSGGMTPPKAPPIPPKAPPTPPKK